MILTCPSCSTRYLIDPTSLGVAGRVVRCARCSHSWSEVPPEDMPKLVDVLPPAEKIKPIPPGSNLPALQKTRIKTAWVGWAALFAVIVAVAAGTLLARDRIIAVWPGAAQIYAGLGLDEYAAGRGLVVRNVQKGSSSEDGKRIVTVTGEITNIFDHSRDVPRVIVQVLDATQNVIDAGYAVPADSELAPGQTTVFSIRITDPPKNAVSLNVVLEGSEM
jgi:predicted Zn finger-like uncharacterized protein